MPKGIQSDDEKLFAAVQEKKKKDEKNVSNKKFVFIKIKRIFLFWSLFEFLLLSCSGFVLKFFIRPMKGEKIFFPVPGEVSQVSQV